MSELQQNLDSNDRLAEGLVRGVQEMGASQAKLPVHIDGETWDVTVRFRGTQPEPDYKALCELAARVLLQHLNDEDYEYSLAGLYAKLTEHK